jgi:hypothetical protein
LALAIVGFLLSDIYFPLKLLDILVDRSAAMLPHKFTVTSAAPLRILPSPDFTDDEVQGLPPFLSQHEVQNPLNNLRDFKHPSHFHLQTTKHLLHFPLASSHRCPFLMHRLLMISS